MKRSCLVFLACLLGFDPAAGQSQRSPEPTLADVAKLRELDLHSAEAWARYLTLAQTVIDKAMRESPEIVRRAVSGDVESLGVSTKGPDLQALDAAIGKWISDKSPPAQLEIDLTLDRAATAGASLQRVAALVGERERKQRLMAEVIQLVTKLFFERLRDIEIDKGKADKLGPSAGNTPKGDLLPRYADWE